MIVEDYKVLNLIKLNTCMTSFGTVSEFSSAIN